MQALHRQAMKGDLESMYKLAKHYQTGNEVEEDLYLAFRLILFAAKHNYKPAYTELGRCYAYAIGTQQDIIEAVHWFQKVDYSECIDVLEFMALCYHTGIGVPQDTTKAHDLWLDAVEKGHPDSFRYCQSVANAGYARGQFMLGHHYQHGIDIPADIQVALQLFHQAAEQGYAPAQCRLGMFYYDGLDDAVKKDYKQARHWLNKAAKQGDHIAQYHLGEIYYNGNGVHVNYKKAYQYYKQSADGWDIPAMQKLAHLYLEGIGTKKDEAEGYYLLAMLAIYNDEEALTLLRNAAMSGNHYAEYAMWVYYQANDDYESGHTWLDKSANKGNSDALCALALHYETENGPAQAKRYFHQAAKNGHPYAQMRHGLLLETFTDYKSPQNKEAYKWIKKATDQKHPQAIYCLGNFYKTGIWVDADAEKAFEIYNKAADLGNVDAFNRLGEAYAYGIGVEVDDAIAFRHFQYAAEQGHSKGQCNLGLSYLNGRGCLQDTHLGFAWITQAASSGDPTGFQMLQNSGLDVTVLIEGYKTSNQVQRLVADNRFGNNFDRIFNETTRSIVPIPPSETSNGK